jgi:hypothetical protein
MFSSKINIELLGMLATIPLDIIGIWLLFNLSINQNLLKVTKLMVKQQSLNA